MDNVNARNHLDFMIFSRVILYVLGRSYRNPEGGDVGVTEVQTIPPFRCFSPRSAPVFVYLKVTSTPQHNLIADI